MMPTSSSTSRSVASHLRHSPSARFNVGGSGRCAVVEVNCLKRWKRPKMGKNGKFVKQPMHVSVGDTVQVIAGSDKGKVTGVTAVRPATSEVCCKGVRVITKHQKPQVEGESGQIARFEGWVHSSNVMHYSTKENVRSRIGHRCAISPCCSGGAPFRAPCATSDCAFVRTSAVEK